MPRQGSVNGSPPCGLHSWAGFGRVSGYMRDVPHWLPYPQRIVYHISALVRRCPTLSPGTLLLYCYYSALYDSYLIALFCPCGVAGPLNADCYPTAPSLLCGWSDGLEWSPRCAASYATDPLCSLSL